MPLRKKSSLCIVMQCFTKETFWQLIWSNSQELIDHEEDESANVPRGWKGTLYVLMSFVCMLDLVTGIQNRKQCWSLGAHYRRFVFITMRLEASWHCAVCAATVITAHLHSPMKDEMSPFGTCSLSYSDCVCFHCVYVYWAHLCSGLTFLYTQPPRRSVCCLLHVQCFWRKRAGVLAAPRRRLPAGQRRLNGSVWPNRLLFWGGNGEYVIRVIDIAKFLIVFIFFSTLL